MAKFQETFDATQVKPREAMDVLPAGKYVCAIEASEWKETKNGDGTYLELTLAVIDGPQTGRKLWDRLNLSNPSTKAMEIAQETLSAICHATGIMSVSDSSQLHNIPLLATVKVKDGEKGPMNEVKGYAKLDGAQPVASSAPKAVAPAAPSKPAAPPWKKQAAA